MSGPLHFDGRRVLVTGGSRGIGREIARLLAARGASVVIAARRSADVERCAAELPGEGHRGLVLDVGEQRDWEAAAAAGAFNRLDGLVSAAAVLSPVGPIGSYEPAEFWRTMRINVLGTLLAVHTCLRPLEAARGAIVVLAGGGATSPQPRYDAYATSKAAVARLCENLALELLPRGVRVNAISPGFVATEIHAATLEAGPAFAGESYFADTERQLDAGGVPPQRTAKLTAFLLSDAAEGIAGRLISAPWDRWEESDFQQRLREDPDLAKVRRIDEQRYTTARELERRQASVAPPERA